MIQEDQDLLYFASSLQDHFVGVNIKVKLISKIRTTFLGTGLTLVWSKVIIKLSYYSDFGLDAERQKKL